MHDVPLPIGDDLNLDVPGVLDELLQEHRPLPERRLCLPLRAPHGLDEILRLPYRAHSPPAAPGGPTQTRSASSTARAKFAFSERKPYPGWTASAPLSFATATIFSMFR